MSHFSNDAQGCEEVRDELNEFALGTLSGRDRARVVDHVEGCSSCRSELAALASVVDAMLWLAPEVDPPLGFELRVLQRLGEGPVRRSHRRRSRALVFAAAALLIGVVGVAAGVAMESSTGGQRPASVHSSVAILTSSGHDVGQVFLSDTTPTWMFMTIDQGGYSGAVWCRVTLAGGAARTVGHFALSQGYGAWMVRVGSGTARVRSAQLVDAKGQVLARATFTT